MSTSPPLGSPTAPTDSAAGVWSHILVVVAIAAGVGALTLAGVERMLASALVRAPEAAAVRVVEDVDEPSRVSG